MKKMYWWAFMGMVVVCVIVGYNQAQTEKRAKQKKAAAEALIHDDSEYNRGFLEGIHATVNHIKFDTNTGKFELEMLDVLKDMKPGSLTNSVGTNAAFVSKPITNTQPRP